MVKVLMMKSGALFMGDMEGGLLKTPRLVMVNKAAQGGHVNVDFLTMVGNPKEMEIGQENIFASYVPNEELLRMYQEKVTGLVLAKTMPRANAN